MNLVFVCAKEEPGERHVTVGLMIQCSHCGRFAVGGYFCEDCDHRDEDSPAELVGHGPGSCVPAVTPAPKEDSDA